ncbi:hypothetical protein NKR23_g8833 [Pleurostoma richardsiae]|uniref:HCNGP-like protein n=1 Tax=Pleurostoma richardsiae TaxID=41990 RepID=A0AA38VF96_9PEZI|nr:hypothetical protein NKR23_g8833 [Pleurostoma richardsiae]
MAGLVSYASSDEDDDEVQVQPEPQKSQKVDNTSIPASIGGPAELNNSISTSKEVVANEASPLPPDSAPTMGPSLPPAGGVGAALAYPTDTSTPPAAADGPSNQGPPLSPYSASRALLRELTLPAVPDFDIPPSPPGSPGPSTAALNAKVKTLLDLKRTKGTHFNARIAQSAALRNPALMDKLLAFVGVETGWGGEDGDGVSGQRAGTVQYATTLSAKLWDPEGFPAWAFKGALRKTQEKVQKERARAPGEPVEFVQAGGAGGGGGVSSRTGTPGTVTGKRKTRFDT